MKGGIYNILKARFLVNEGSTKTGGSFFLVILGIIMIANTHRFEQKYLKLLT
jgi:hypothetical protein